MSLLGAAVRVVRLGADMVDGSMPGPAEVARALVDIGLELVPADDLRAHLDAAAVARAEAAADAAERVKFR